MCVKCVNEVYIKEDDWGSYTTPNTASWARKFMCSAKNEVMTKLSSEVWLLDSKFSIKLRYKKLMGVERNASSSSYVRNKYSRPKRRIFM